MSLLSVLIKNIKNRLSRYCKLLKSITKDVFDHVTQNVWLPRLVSSQSKVLKTNI